MEQQQYYGGPASGIWCERCGRAGHESKMCEAREPRWFNGLCDTCCELGHLSCDCLLQRDRIYSDVPTLSSPPQSNRSGPGYDIPCYDLPISPASYSGRTGGPGYDIPCFPPQCSGSHCYRAKPFVRRYSGGDGTVLSQQQQPGPRPFSSFVRGQRYSGGHSIAPPQHTYCGSNNGYGTNEGPQQQYGRGADGSAGYDATFPQQQPGPRPFSSFVRDQRYNGGHSTAPPQ